MNRRPIDTLIPAVQTSDGAGVRIRRSLGQSQAARLDPFLMLDEFGSDDAADYIAGFPAHPHRGFETVTYMLDGHMLHEDHLGNRGHLGPGGVQWMTAARGIIHSEMPQQESGRMRGFQLWLNLPAARKMGDPSYADIPAEGIPVVDTGTATVKVIAGSVGTTRGAVRGAATDPTYLDVRLAPDGAFTQPVATDHNALLYVYEGSLDVAWDAGSASADRGHAAVLGAGDTLEVHAGGAGARFLLLAARPLNEPVVQYGPFVMNTREEIEQALRDYRDGTLASAATAR